MNAIAQVEPLTTARSLRGPFDYRLSGEMREQVEVGSLLLVPFARRRILAVVTALAASSELPDDRLAEPIEALSQGVPAELVRLGLWVAEQYCSTPARGLALVTPPGVGTGAAKGRMTEKSVLYASLTDAGRAAPSDPSVRLTDSQRAALRALTEYEHGLPTAMAREAIGADTAALRRLEGRGLVAISSRQTRRSPSVNAVGSVVERPELTEDQAAALGEVDRALNSGPADLLLHGVTGSGKTEVYLGAAESAVGAGRGVIVMVPEIALTPQILTRFVARFGERVAVLHSQLSAGERHDEWLRLRRGEADIAIGPRSAVFAPVSDLGLVIVDEEHDASYKQDGDPRYDARDVALRRATEQGAVLLSGSATPRAEGWLRSQRIELPTRVDGSALPEVTLLDMAGERGALHRRTSAALAEVAAKGEKAIILLNRRGWSNFLTCSGCGHAWVCPNCDVTLVLHMQSRSVGCHHCGHRESIPEHCPECDSAQIARHGSGTERLEHDLREALGDAVEVFRLDADSVKRSSVDQLLARFERAESGVLVGTQMVAKGHDFPEVTLGVVVDADSTLNFPDFRAEERTFALVAQLAGRSGRGSVDGRVLVQTMSADARSLKFAADHDAAGFVTAELERREAFSYPPYAQIIKLQTASPDYAAAQAAAESLAGEIDLNGARLLGPAPLFKRKGLERFQIELKSLDRGTAVDAVRAAVDLVSASAAGRGVKFSVDVDPQ